MGLAMALIIVMMTVATLAAIQVEASGPVHTPKTQTKAVSGTKTKVTAALKEMGSASTAETAAKVIQDKEMEFGPYSTTFFEKNPELATVMAIQTIEQQRAAPDVANVTTTSETEASTLKAETAAKVIQDKEMELGPYSTTFFEKNPELATVMATNIVDQQQTANHVAKAALPGWERWMTVADPLGQEFQLAYLALLHQDYPAAAREIRSAANYLKAEETALEQEVPEAGFAKDLAVRSTTIDQLMRLADRIEQGQTSMKELNSVLTKAYQVDPEHGVSKLLIEQKAVGGVL
jgi:hypothetical protein